MITCFQMYFQPIYVYIKRSFELATDNSGLIMYTLTAFTGSLDLIAQLFNVNLFGLSNYLLSLVILTVLIDAYYGVKKSLKKSKQAVSEAKKSTKGSPEEKRWLKTAELKRFQIQKLQFTFFKCFTLLAYLFFVKTLIHFDTDGFLGEVLGFTSGIMLKIPVAIFWYYDFKSIGENSTYIYGKKAPIFTIVENILEFKINKYLKNGQTDTSEN